MLKLSCSILFLFAVALPVAAQERLTWSRDDKRCDSIYIDGTGWRIVNDGRVFLGVTGFDDDGYTTISVFLGNLSERRFDFLPATAILQTWKKQDDYLNEKPPTVLAPTPAEQIAAKMRNRARFSSALGSIGAAFATQRATVTTNTGQSATVTVPDSTAQARAAVTGAVRTAEADAAGNALIDAALRANTLFPGSKIAGDILFKAKRHDIDRFIITIDGREYAFLFGKEK